MQALYEEPISYDIILLNEYDLMIVEHPYSIRSKCVRGLWELRGKRVFAFSATSSSSHERLLNSCISEPIVIKFKSEYEMVRGASPIVDPSVH